MSSARMVQHASAQRAILSAQRRLNASLPFPAYASALNRHRNLPTQIQALAILLPRRGYATEQSTSQNSGANYPPPGFNAAEAKKPLSKEAEQKSAADKAAELAKLVSVPSGQPTGTEKSKAMEQMTLTELAAEKTAADEKLKKEGKKLTLGQKIKKELHHYWDGTKLLATEVRISTKLALKMAGGYELSRRENRQLQRTVQDLGRLGPFSVFLIVPFAELLLPVALKLFPNLLPSTYEGQKSKEAKVASLRTTRKEVSSFLRETLRETGLPVSAANAKKEEFTEFFRKLRATGDTPSHEDVIKVCKIFKDDLTLDNLSRPQLVAMCRYMNLNSFGTDSMLRYQIRHRMRQIKRDDKAISYEGVDSLSVPELQMAGASRGLRTQGSSPGRLRDDLQTWLDLRLKHGVPSTLLVLSNAYTYTQSRNDGEISSQVEALQAVLSSIPEELFHEIELEVHNAEGAATNKQRLEVLREQEDLIEDENEQSQENASSGRETPKDTEFIDEKEEVKAEEKPEQTEDQDPQAAEAKDAEAETEHAKEVEKSRKAEEQKA